MSFESLVEQLGEADFYPHPVEVITTIETHISIVFLTGPFAYKLKKPVNFGFLDFSTLELRHHYCQLELQLNRRTAPELYLEVLPVYECHGNYALSCKDQMVAPCEYLVKMNQFDPNKVLGRHLQDHTLSNMQIQNLAEQIARFHLQAESVSKDEPYGHPDDVVHPMLDNFPSLLETFRHPDQQYRLRQLAQWTHFTQKSLFDDLLLRKTQGYVKACHGDMHLDNITLLDERPVLFDGIEFNEQFRWIDVLSDLAFLMIDLDFRKQIVLRRKLLSHYLAITGDYEGLKLLRFFQTYRAMVRSKITALRYHQLDKNTIEGQKCLDTAWVYFDQAENYAYVVPEPTLILMQGVAGSGKSFYAEHLLEAVDAVVISSDRERKRFFGMEAHQRPTQEQIPQIYSADMNRKTYQKLLEISECLLKEGYSVIVDATFLQYKHRKPFETLATNLKVNYRLFSISPNIPFLEQNLAQRLQEKNNPSDAGLDVMRDQCQRFEEPLPHENAHCIPPRANVSIDELKNWLF